MGPRRLAPFGAEGIDRLEVALDLSQELCQLGAGNAGEGVTLGHASVLSAAVFVAVQGAPRS
jgi:hypothetical protein